MQHRPERTVKGHRLADLDDSNPGNATGTSVALCECGLWSTLTSGEQRRHRAAYAHAMHAYNFRHNNWACAGFRGPEPEQPNRERYMSRLKFKTYKDAA